VLQEAYYRSTMNAAIAWLLKVVSQKVTSVVTLTAAYSPPQHDAIECTAPQL